jgi:hypothetical protein
MYGTCPNWKVATCGLLFNLKLTEIHNTLMGIPFRSLIGMSWTTPPVTGNPQQMQPMPQPMVPGRRLNGITVAGAILVLVGLIMMSVMPFYIATTSPYYYLDYRWIYIVDGAGTILEGVGLFLAFLGLAIGYRH